MLHLPDDDHKIFEVAIYNRTVRDKVKLQKKHTYFDDRWAKPQKRNVVARDEAEARVLISERFPPEDGFVIDSICPCRY
jgi:hypothetical protein